MHLGGHVAGMLCCTQGTWFCVTIPAPQYLPLGPSQVLLSNDKAIDRTVRNPSCYPVTNVAGKIRHLFVCSTAYVRASPQQLPKLGLQARGRRQLSEPLLRQARGLLRLLVHQFHSADETSGTGQG